PGAVAQGQMLTDSESTVLLPSLSPPSSTEPLRQRFFPPIGPSGTQRLTLTPFLSVGERYDDNIFLTPSPKESDFITLPAAGIRLRYAPSRETSGGLDYRVGGEIFARHSDQNAVSHEGALSFA